MEHIDAELTLEKVEEVEVARLEIVSVQNEVLVAHILNDGSSNQELTGGGDAVRHSVQIGDHARIIQQKRKKKRRWFPFHKLTVLN